MSNTATPYMTIFKAEQFLESITEPESSNLYMTIGRVHAWSNEASPDIVEVTPTTINKLWKNMMGGKRITGNDVRHVVYRNDWQANTVYSQWDQDQNMFVGQANANFYVVTNDWNVYKCLFNNNGANSTIQPNTTTTSILTTQDGYIWKFLYNITPFERSRFVNDQYIPVKKLSYNNNSLQWTVQDAAVDGAIYAIEITNPGEGYANANTISIAIDGDGEAALALATINAASNTLSTIYMTNYGSGYSNAKITINDTGNGINGQARALYSPYGGHGSNPIYELGGTNLMISLRMKPNETDLLTTNAQFRQVALVSNPIRFGTSNVESNTYFSAMTEITVSGASGDYAEGEYVYQGVNTVDATFIGLVAEWNSSNSKLKLTNVTGSPTTDTLIGANTGSLSFLISYKNEEVIHNSGQVLFINNIEAIQRDPDQTEEFKIILNF